MEMQNKEKNVRWQHRFDPNRNADNIIDDFFYFAIAKHNIDVNKIQSIILKLRQLLVQL
jgi:hypothetical protein